MLTFVVVVVVVVDEVPLPRDTPWVVGWLMCALMKSIWAAFARWTTGPIGNKVSSKSNEMRSRDGLGVVSEEGNPAAQLGRWRLRCCFPPHTTTFSRLPNPCTTPISATTSSSKVTLQQETIAVSFMVGQQTFGCTRADVTLRYVLPPPRSTTILFQIGRVLLFATSFIRVEKVLTGFLLMSVVLLNALQASELFRSTGSFQFGGGG